MSLRAVGRVETGHKNTLAKRPTRHTGDVHCRRCILNGADVMKEGELIGRALLDHPHDNYTPKEILKSVSDAHSTTSALVDAGGVPQDIKVADLRASYPHLDNLIIKLLDIY